MITRKLVSDARPTYPVMLAVLLILAPVYLAYIPYWYWTGTYRISESALNDLLHTMHHMPAIVYFICLHLVLRRKVSAWWRLPATSAELGRALWWETMGIPLLVFALAEAVNAAVVISLFKYWWQYANIVRDQYVDLSVIVINWGAWSFFRYGRFRRLHAGSTAGYSNTRDHVKWIWPSVGSILAIITLIELYLINIGSANWKATEFHQAGYALLALTATILYLRPTLSDSLNSLREERSGSSSSQRLAAIPQAVLFLLFLFGFCSLIWNAIVYLIDRPSMSEVLKSFRSAISGLLLFILLGTVVSWYIFFVGRTLYKAMQERSLTAALSGLEERLPTWLRRRWYGLVAVDGLLFAMVILVPLILWVFLSEVSVQTIGLVLGVVGAVCVAVTLRTKRKVLAALPVSTGRVSGRLQLSAALIATIPFLLGLPVICLIVAFKGESDEVATFASAWMLTVAFVQIWAPFRMGGSSATFALRGAVYVSGAIWSALLIANLWHSPVDLVISMISHDGQASASSWSLPSWNPALAAIVLVLATGYAFSQTNALLTRGQGPIGRRTVAKQT